MMDDEFPDYDVEAERAETLLRFAASDEAPEADQGKPPMEPWLLDLKG